MRGISILGSLMVTSLTACSADEANVGTGSGGSAPSNGGATSGGAGAGGNVATTGGSAGTGTGGTGGVGNSDAGSSGGAISSGDAAGSGGSNVVTPNQSCASPSPPFTSQEQALVDLPADSWFTVPNTKIRPLCPTSIGGSCNNVIDAWSGGTFDPVHNQMLIFGGGHGDYSGNEVYAFDVATFAWSRLTDPSPDSPASQDPLPDGKPVSRHSYDGISYVTHADRMFVHGGSRWQDGSGTNVSWAFDPSSKTWENRNPAATLPLANCCDEASAYDPKTKRVYFHLTKSLAAYDWDQNTWVTLQDYGEPPFWPRYEAWGDKRGVLDSKRDLLWFFGGGLVLVYDIAGATHVTDDWVTTGGTPYTNAGDVGSHTEQVINTGGGEIITGKAPGVDYDTAADDLVGWVGGAPWILDLDSKVWTQSAATGGPTNPVDTGTYGRWRYIPRLNVFMLVNSVDDDAHFYKHTSGCGQ
jgi:hypothetical protein